MKKIIAILIIAVAIMASCKKNNDTNNVSCAPAVVRYGGDPAADGVGWYLMVGDSTGGTPEYPQNLAVTYMKEGLAVNVCYYKSDKDFSCFCAPPLPKMVIITSISKR
jgi:hypothetical protein